MKILILEINRFLILFVCVCGMRAGQNIVKKYIKHKRKIIDKIIQSTCKYKWCNSTSVRHIDSTHSSFKVSSKDGILLTSIIL